MSELKKWLESSDENRRAFAQETLILQVTEAIWEALEKRRWSKKELADALHVSKSHVTQMLNGSRNMTLRTLSDITFSLGLQMKLRLCDKEEAIRWGVWEASAARNVLVANQYRLDWPGVMEPSTSRGVPMTLPGRLDAIIATQDIRKGMARTGHYPMMSNMGKQQAVGHG